MREAVPSPETLPTLMSMVAALAMMSRVSWIVVRISTAIAA
jgi:flagellar biogenesis protein FliO